jgi:triosephosphate isomerase
MKSKRRPIIIGNWKMNKTVPEAVELATAIKNVLGALGELEVGIAPPYTALWPVARRIEDSTLQLAAQNCHEVPSGAFTGEISIAMLREVGCRYVLVGHSERRQFFGEDDSGVNRKILALLNNGVRPVLCIGEQLSEREGGQTFEVVGRQLERALQQVPAEQVESLVIAYEPVWAIGTGKVATTVQAQEVHAFIRKNLAQSYREKASLVRIQYGGSVKPDNIKGLMAQPDIDGALVGGASLAVDSFVELLRYGR